MVACHHHGDSNAAARAWEGTCISWLWSWGSLEASNIQDEVSMAYKHQVKLALNKEEKNKYRFNAFLLKLEL